MVDEGGDWDRRNRLKGNKSSSSTLLTCAVYEAIQYLRIRNMKKAADLFLETLSTFTSTELFTYQQFIVYTVLTSVLSLDRVALKSKVLHAPEILAVVGEIPHLGDFLNSFFNSNFSLFFSALAHMQKQMFADMYFAPHARYFVREMRIKAYAQLLESYRSVQLTSMAAAFGVSVEFLDKCVGFFCDLLISTGNCRGSLLREGFTAKLTKLVV